MFIFLFLFVIYGESIMFKRHKHDWEYYSNDRSKDNRDRRFCKVESCGKEEKLSTVVYTEYDFSDIPSVRYPNPLVGFLMSIIIAVVAAYMPFALVIMSLLMKG
jgi:hypothetical protein